MICFKTKDGTLSRSSSLDPGDLPDDATVISESEYATAVQDARQKVSDRGAEYERDQLDRREAATSGMRDALLELGLKAETVDEFLETR